MTKKAVVWLILAISLLGIVFLINFNQRILGDNNILGMPPESELPMAPTTTVNKNLPISQNNMFNKEDTLKITNITYRSESTGSIDPSSSAYRQFWSYVPTAEESAALLEEIKNSDSVSLKDFLATFEGELTTFVRSDSNPDGAVGGSNRSWKITISNGENAITIYDTTNEFQTSSFPYALVEENGSHRGEPKDSPLALPTPDDNW